MEKVNATYGPYQDINLIFIHRHGYSIYPKKPIYLIQHDYTGIKTFTVSQMEVVAAHIKLIVQQLCTYEVRLVSASFFFH